MASPFKAFRKHQKTLIVVFGILLMISFLVVGSVSQFMDGGRGPQVENEVEVVATWDEGEITQRDLQRQFALNRLVARFTQDIAAKAREMNGIPQTAPFFGASIETEMVAHMTLLRKAELMGVIVDDQAVATYLNQLGDSKVTPEQRGAIFRRLAERQRGVTVEDLMEQLRRELIVRNMGAIAHGGVGAPSNTGQWALHSSPTDSWESIDRMINSVRVESFPIEVEDYVSKAADPSKDELEAFYEKYKDRVSLPGSSEPGFGRPEKSSYAYVRIDYNPFFEAEKKRITDAQVKAYYEENKSDFIAPKLPAFEDDGAKDGADKDGADKDGGEKPGADAKEANEQDKKEAGDGEPAKKDAEDKSEDAPTKDSGEKQETPAADQSDAKTDDAGAQKDDSGDQVESDEATTDAEPKSSAPAKDDDKPKTDDPKDDNKPKDDSDASETPKDEVKFKPLEEVADEIRSVLASAKVAREQMKAEVAPIRNALAAYLREYGAWKFENRDEEKPATPQPPAPNPKGLAAGVGLTSEQTNLLNQFEVADTELAMIRGESGSPDQPEPASFEEMMLQGAGRQAFSPAVIYSPSMAEPTMIYVIWRTKHVEAEVPELTAIRDQVVHAWKLKEARTLAEKAAEGLAAKARKAGGPLKGVLGAAAFETDSFRTGSPSEEIEGIGTVDSEFLDAVYLLRLNEVGVAMDSAKSRAFVVRLIDEGMPSEERQERFHRFAGFTFQLSQQNNQFFGQWVQSLMDEAELEWK